MLCPKCLRSVDNGCQQPSGFWQCAQCGVQFLKPLSDAAASETKPAPSVEASAGAPPPPAPSSASEPSSSSASGSRGMGIGFFVLVIVALVVMRPRSERLPMFNITPADAKSSDCFTKAKCVVVYVTPWCPSCHSSKAAIRALADEWKRSSDIGITVVVGRDQPERLKAMAQEIDTGAFLDLDNSFHQAAKVDGVPYWLVVEAPSKIVKRFAGGLPNSSVAREILGVGAN